MLSEENPKNEQDRNLKQMNYPDSEDVFENETIVPLDNDGEPLADDYEEDDMDFGLDVPGSELDNEQESLGSEDEENNYYSLDDQDNHEEENDDLEDE